MKKLITAGAFFISLCLASQESKIHYFYSSEIIIESRELKAVVGSNVFTLITFQDELCSQIEKTGDFNKNGYEDVLVEIINGCGGNCCGNSYMIFSYDGKSFQKTEQIGYDWDGIEVSESSLEFNFIVETADEGVGNTTMCDNKIETFRLHGYNLELVQSIKEEKLPAITEIESKDFIDKENEKLFLSYDLDGDKIQDIITCVYWARWGRILNWKINFGNGLIYKGETSPKRIGILNTKSHNLNDIVLECNEIIKWDGSRYK